MPCERREQESLGFRNVSYCTCSEQELGSPLRPRGDKE